VGSWLALAHPSSYPCGQLSEARLTWARKQRACQHISAVCQAAGCMAPTWSFAGSLEHESVWTTNLTKQRERYAILFVVFVPLVFSRSKRLAPEWHDSRQVTGRTIRGYPNGRTCDHRTPVRDDTAQPVAGRAASNAPDPPRPAIGGVHVFEGADLPIRAFVGVHASPLSRARASHTLCELVTAIDRR
jgi:hypothetical protein